MSPAAVGSSVVFASELGSVAFGLVLRTPGSFSYYLGSGRNGSVAAVVAVVLLMDHLLEESFEELDCEILGAVGLPFPA